MQPHVYRLYNMHAPVLLNLLNQLRNRDQMRDLPLPGSLRCYPFYGGGSVVVDLLFFCTSHCLLGFCVGLCLGMHYFVSFLVLQSSWRGRESWLLCFYCLSDVLYHSCSYIIEFIKQAHCE